MKKLLIIICMLIGLSAYAQTELLPKEQVEASTGLMIDTIYADSWRYTTSLYGDCIFLIGLTEDDYRFISVIYVERHKRGHTLIGTAESCLTRKKGRLAFTDEGCRKDQIYKFNEMKSSKLQSNE